MAATKERSQNPTKGDTVRLRKLFFNTNNLADVASIDDVSIYILDTNEITDMNPEGRILVEVQDVANIVKDDTGTYHLDVTLTPPKYVIGKYYDVWTVTTEVNEPQTLTEEIFAVYPQLWYSASEPIIYDFSFRFSPNRMRVGCNQYLRIDVIPNVPRASDLARYYENIAILADIQISIEEVCGPCVPAENDLRMIVENAPVDFRKKCQGFYRLDTTDLDVGIYNVWFNLSLGGNTYVSAKMALELFD